MSSSSSLRLPILGAVAAGAMLGVWLAYGDAPAPEVEAKAPEPAVELPPEPAPMETVAVPEPVPAPLPPVAAAPEPEPAAVPVPSMAPPTESAEEPVDEPPEEEEEEDTLKGPLEGEVREHAIKIAMATTERAMETGDIHALKMVQKFLDQPQAEGVLDESEERAVNVAIDCVEQAEGAQDTALAFLHEDNASTFKDRLKGLCFPDGLPEAPKPEPEPALEAAELPAEEVEEAVVE